MEGNLRFKIDWAGLIVGRKFTVFALFYFFIAGNFQVQAPWGVYIWRGNLTEGFLRHEFEGLIHGGAYFRNFTVSKVLPSAAVPLPLSSGNLTQSHFLNTSFFFYFLATSCTVLRSLTCINRGRLGPKEV